MVKQNPFRTYLEKKGDSRSYEDFLYDHVFKEEEKGFKFLEAAQTLANNWEEMNGKGSHYVLSLCDSVDPLETMVD